MTTLATRIAHDHQPTATGCTCGKRLIGGKCARGSLVSLVEHVAEVTQEAVAAPLPEARAWRVDTDGHVRDATGAPDGLTIPATTWSTP